MPKHQYPIGILNIDGFYDDMLRMHETFCKNGVISEKERDLLKHSNNIEDLFVQLAESMPE